MQNQISLQLKRDPEKVNAVFAYWKKLILKAQDYAIASHASGLSVPDRVQLESKRNHLRALITRCSRLKVSVHRNIIFQ